MPENQNGTTPTRRITDHESVSIRQAEGRRLPSRVPNVRVSGDNINRSNEEFDRLWRSILNFSTNIGTNRPLGSHGAPVLHMISDGPSLPISRSQRVPQHNSTEWEPLLALQTLETAQTRPRSRRRLSGSGRGVPSPFPPSAPSPTSTTRRQSGLDMRQQIRSELSSSRIIGSISGVGDILASSDDEIDIDTTGILDDDRYNDVNGSDVRAGSYRAGAHIDDIPFSSPNEMSFSDTIGRTGPRAIHRRNKRHLPSLTSLNVRQSWNTKTTWKPYIYQTPPQNIHNFMSDTEAYSDTQQKRMHPEKSPLISFTPRAELLPFDCIFTDSSGRGNIRNILVNDKSRFVTARAANVNLEFELVTDHDVPYQRHCIIEKILIKAPRLYNACTELMVFSSSRRCTFEELSEYDNFTFEKYEQLANTIEKSGCSAIDDPLPLAYFWLVHEERLLQLQTLPHSRTCRYIYIKMLRPKADSNDMSLQLVKFFGWRGSSSFSEAALC